MVLEAITDLPDFCLAVCGTISDKGLLSNTHHPAFENDFDEAFHKELLDTPNIRTVGWVDVDIRQFIDILSRDSERIPRRLRRGSSFSRLEVISCVSPAPLHTYC